MLGSTTHTVKPVEGGPIRRVNRVDLRPVDPKRGSEPTLEAGEASTGDVEDERLEEGIVLLECTGQMEMKVTHALKLKTRWEL